MPMNALDLLVARGLLRGNRSQRAEGLEACQRVQPRLCTLLSCSQKEQVLAGLHRMLPADSGSAEALRRRLGRLRLQSRFSVGIES
jgi:hypothetical protein